MKVKSNKKQQENINQATGVSNTLLNQFYKSHWIPWNVQKKNPMPSLTKRSCAWLPNLATMEAASLAINCCTSTITTQPASEWARAASQQYLYKTR